MLARNTDPPGPLPLLECAGIAKHFGATRVLEDVSLQVPARSITALIGQNGAGKSTLFKILLGLVPADRGRASLAGQELLGLPLHEKSSLGLAWLPQECSSFPELTVRENLLALLEVLPIDRGEARERHARLLALTGLEEIAGRRFRLLSAGEQRRLEIAKVLATDPRMLLLDEPFSGLDPRIIKELARMLAELAERGIGILLTDHNVHAALDLAESVHLLAGGRVLCSGPPRQVLENPDAQRVYLGA
ncbi:MAG: ATP-binding cassette domain-containing protein [Planctomycetota bacterium]